MLSSNGPKWVTLWADGQMIVWLSGNTSGKYDPALDAWTPVSPLNAPRPRPYGTAVWTGELMIVWGGRIDTNPERVTDSGGRYRPETNSWTPVSGMPNGRMAHPAVWTGGEPGPTIGM